MSMEPKETDVEATEGPFMARWVTSTGQAKQRRFDFFEELLLFALSRDREPGVERVDIIIDKTDRFDRDCKALWKYLHANDSRKKK